MAGKIKVPSELVPSQSNKIMLRSKYVHDDVKGHTQEEINQALEEQIESKVIEAGGVNWDTVPTAGSNNAVKSKDIKAALEKVTGYFVLDSNVTESTVAKTVTVADFPVLALGGSIKIKMLTKNTATNPTLRIGPANAIAYPLYYNENRASASNSWDENEIISVFFDGSKYIACNSKGSGGKAEKNAVEYVTNDIPIIALNTNYSVGDRLKDEKGAMLLVINPVTTIKNTETVAVGDLKTANTSGHTYKAISSITAYTETLSENTYKLGHPTKVSLDISTSTISAGTISVTFGSNTISVTIDGSETDAASVATKIKNALLASSIEEWSFTTNDSSIIATCYNIGNNSTIAFSIADNTSGISGVKNILWTGSNIVCYWNGSIWTEKTVNDLKTEIFSDITTLEGYNGLIALVTQSNSITKDINNLKELEKNNINKIYDIVNINRNILSNSIEKVEGSEVETINVTQQQFINAGHYYDANNKRIVMKKDSLINVNLYSNIYIKVPYTAVSGNVDRVSLAFHDKYRNCIASLDQGWSLFNSKDVEFIYDLTEERFEDVYYITLFFGSNNKVINTSNIKFGDIVTKLTISNFNTGKTIDEKYNRLEKHTNLLAEQTFVNGFLNADYTWVSNSNKYKGYFIPIVGGKTYKIMASIYNCSFCFLKDSNHTQGTKASFVGERITLSPNSEIIKTAPKAATYMWVSRLYNDTVYAPKKITVFDNLLNEAKNNIGISNYILSNCINEQSKENETLYFDNAMFASLSWDFSASTARLNLKKQYLIPVDGVKRISIHIPNNAVSTKIDRASCYLYDEYYNPVTDLDLSWTIKNEDGITIIRDINLVEDYIYNVKYVTIYLGCESGTISVSDITASLFTVTLEYDNVRYSKTINKEDTIKRFDFNNDIFIASDAPKRAFMKIGKIYGAVTWHIFMNLPDYNFAIRVYDKDPNNSWASTGNIIHDSTWLVNKSIFTLPYNTSYKYMYLGFRKSDDSNLTSEDINLIREALSGYVEYYDIKSDKTKLEKRNIVSKKAVKICAHRGFHLNNVPENSLDAYRIAGELGFDWVETDFCPTSDDELVLMHDTSINRTMKNASDYSDISNTVNVLSKTLSELQENYVLASFDQRMRRGIPTLEEFFMYCKAYNLFPLPEIKETGTTNEHVLKAYNLGCKVMGEGNFGFCSFGYSLLDYARTLSPNIILAYIGTSILGTISTVSGESREHKNNMWYPKYSENYVTNSEIENYHKKGMLVGVWCPPVVDFDAVLKKNVDMIAADYIAANINNAYGFLFDSSDSWRDFVTDGVFVDRALVLKTNEKLYCNLDDTIIKGMYSLDISYIGTITFNAPNLSGTRTSTDKNEHKYQGLINANIPKLTITATSNTVIYHIKFAVVSYD